MEKRKVNILVLENNPLDGKMIDEFLQKSVNPMFHIKHSDKTEHAIELILENESDAVLIDYDFSVNSGIELFDMIFAVRPDIPLIMLVEKNNENIGENSLNKGADDYLVKEHLSSELLIRSIRYAVERKKLISEKRQSENQYLNVFNSMSEGFALHEVIFDNDGKPCDYRFLDINPAFEKLTGLKRPEIIGKTHNEVLPDNDPYWVKAYGEVALTGEIKKFDNYSPALKRHYKVYAFRPAKGQFAVLFTDITDFVQSEQALKISHNELDKIVKERTNELNDAFEAVKIEQRRFIDVLDALPVYVILLTEDYRVRFDNKFFREHFGESHGKCCYDYLFGRSEPCEVCETYKVLRTKQSLEWEWTGPDGHKYFISDFPFTDRDGSKLILEMGLDITERKQAEAAVQKEHQRFYQVLETLPAMICLLTLDYQVTFANRSFRERYGEPKGRHCYDYCFGYTKPCGFCELSCVQKTGKPNHWELTDPVDGSVFTVDDFPFTDVDGSPLILRMKVDITSQKKDSAELDKYRHKLEELVEERTLQLGEANDLLQIEIAERKSKEEALGKSEEKYRKIVETANEGIWVVDSTETTTYVNGRMADMLGYSIDEMIGKKSFEFIPEDDKKDSKPDNEISECYESKFLRKDGTTLWTLSNVSPILNDSGVFAGTLRMLTDITDRKKIETDLLEREIQLSTIVENLEEGVVVSTIDGAITHWNKAALKMHGFPCLEECKKHLSELTDIFELSDMEGNILPLEKWPLSRILKGEHLQNLEIRIRHINDRWVKIFGYGGSLVLESHGIPYLALVTVNDITDRKKNEIELARLASFPALNPNPIVETDHHGNIYFLNAAAENKFPDLKRIGCKHELLQTIEPAFDFFDNNDENVYEREIKVGNVWYHQAFYYIRESGLARIYMRNITELVHATEDLKRSNENLEQFAYVASHDLQEPLRIIASYSELLERRYKDKLDSDADDFIEFIVDGAKRMQQLINDLLAYSRIGRMNKKVENIDCNVVLEKVINNMMHVIEENKAVITFDDLPKVKGVEINFIQLFQNLISNAIKFRREEPPEIHIGVQKTNDEWVFSVKDNGIGIEPQYKNRIFLIFQRLHSRDKYPGTGIGLSICKKIIDTQNGKIWVESNVDKGSTFYFSIPR